MGGMHGFGPVERDEAQFHEDWERLIVGLMLSVRAHHLFSLDAFRHAVERMPPAQYLGSSYFKRWRLGMERLLIEHEIITREELDERYRLLSAGESLEPGAVGDPSRYPKGSHGQGFHREIDATPRFAVGDDVRAIDFHPPGHTRLPRYVRGREGTVERVHPAYILPDTTAHERGENPQYLYSVRFEGRTLWGPHAEPSTSLRIDLFESYLEPATAAKLPGGAK